MNWLSQLDRRLVARVSDKLLEVYEASADELQAEKEFWEDTLQAWIQYFPMGVAWFFGWEVFLSALVVAAFLYFLRQKLSRSKRIW